MPVHSGNTVTLTPQDELQARLADPHTVEALNRLLDRLDMVTASIDMFSGFINRSPEVADNISDTVEELRQHDDGHAAAFIGKLPTLARAGERMADLANSPSFEKLIDSGLLERLAAQQTIDSLTLLLEKLDLIVFAINAIDGFLRRGDVIADSIADSVGDLRAVTTSVDAKNVRLIASGLPQLVEAGQQLLASGALSKVSELAEAGMLLSKSGFFEPKVVSLLGEMGRLASESYAGAKTAPQKQYGVFDLVRLLKEPAIQRTINVLVAMSRQFGQKLA
jgi:hypothetical protein